MKKIDLVLNHFKGGEGLSQNGAYDLYKITSLKSIVDRLRIEGYRVEFEKIDGNKKLWYMPDYRRAKETKEEKFFSSLQRHIIDEPVAIIGLSLYDSVFDEVIKWGESLGRIVEEIWRNGEMRRVRFREPNAPLPETRLQSRSSTNPKFWGHEV